MGSPAPSKIDATELSGSLAGLDADAIRTDDLFQLAIEASPSGVLIVEPAGSIVVVNHALEQQFGYARNELIGQPVEVLLPEALQRLHTEHRLSYLGNPQTRPMGAGRELFGRHKDGSQIPVEIGLNSIQTTAGLFVLASVVDIRERRRNEDEQRRALDERLEFERLLSELSARFVNLGTEQIDQAIEDAQRRIGDMLDLDRSALFQLSEGEDDFVLTHHWTRAGFEQPPERVSAKEQFPWSLAKIRNGDVAAFSSLDEVPDARERESLRYYGTNSGAAIPFSVGGRIVGVISFATAQEARPWPPETVNRLRLLAQVIASALSRKQSDAALHTALGEVLRLRDLLQAENVYLRREVQERLGPGPVVGRSRAVLRVLEQVEQVAATDSTVLLLGETGTGKELFATQIHERSARRARTMVRVNCAAIPATLIESELFGREKGAFTGALTRQIGRFELADHSTIFLDEIGDLPPEAQIKLLRVLEEKEFERLGSPKAMRVDVRIIAATHRSLEERIAEGTFREDLFYRLNVFPVRVPPLRERVEDIPLLVWKFVGEFSKALGKPIEAISRENMAALQKYSWPGNVRELRNVVERAMIVATRPHLTIALPTVSTAAGKHYIKLDDVEREHIRSVLERTGWRIRGSGGAADQLGFKPTTLETRMAKLGLRRPS
ncbi:MAG: sigma 54-interacting transcriptional regulator [Acidobacteriaceae bacterium]|nr:sigma 54-interacting transcriptional regulator [Acidobacteriaceae bacterium]